MTVPRRSVGGARGPLRGVVVTELAGLGPAPYAAMLLADLGAEVIRIDRPQRHGDSSYERDRAAADPTVYHLHRGRQSLVLDLRKADGVEIAMRLIERSDVLIEGYRPGVAERLGLGPGAVHERNPRLVYGRMTGWGQSGPAAHTAGHDLTYLAVTGALHGLAHRDGPPVTPPPIIGDMAGGGVFLAMGILAALTESARSGLGQVVDAAIVDGVTSLTTMVRSLAAQGRWTDVPAANFSDGGAPYYTVYRTSDDKHIAIAALEEPFWTEFLRVLGQAGEQLPDRNDPANHPLLRQRLTELFGTRTRDEWAALFADTDACVAPVLTLEEASAHPQLAARRSLLTTASGEQPAPAPRFDRTPAGPPSPPPVPGEDTDRILRRLGIDSETRRRLHEDETVQSPSRPAPIPPITAQAPMPKEEESSNASTRQS
ncbi:CaiB/BaiF CoA-transferase family protein [Nocardia sp. BSTN01]|uniref:CaiB/BaiF CoA transferase family protein n=1 Tax=Nocardia sp. BSTN01 TaxID=2783665 RepID=UPI00281544EA|nr:CaiB/BaiF CoA-transferase family protein [Nocardia sp. BSTN01]